MKQIFLATNNQGKVNSLQNALSNYDIEIKHVPLELPEPRSDNLKIIAKGKVLFAFDKIKKPCVAIDSGFYIYSLKGFPKTFVNFVLETIGIDGILRLVAGKSRDCEFRSCMAYFDKSLDEPVYFESITKGSLAELPRKQIRKSWGKLHSIFIPEGSKKTLTEMSEEEHKAFDLNKRKHHFTKKFAEWISRRK